MSIDTAAKRFAALNLGEPWRGINAFPDGGDVLGDTAGDAIGDIDGSVVGLGPIDRSNRAAFAYLYGGFFVGTQFTLTPLSGSYAWSGNATTLTPTTHIGTADKRFSALNISSPWRGLNTFPTGSINLQGRFSLSHLYDGFAVGNVNHYTLTAEAGVFVWDGEPSFSDFEVGANTGTFEVTGNESELVATRLLTAEAGAFVWTGYEAQMDAFTSATIAVDAGAFGLTGNPVTFDRPRALVPSIGSFEITGPSIVLTYTDSSGIPHEGEPTRTGLKPAGKSTKRRYEVEIDGKVYNVESEEEALYLLEKVEEEAKAKAKLAMERAVKAAKRPGRKVLADARKYLELPEITVSDDLAEPAKVIEEEVEELYRNTLQDIEIAVLLRKQAEQDEEETILLLSI